MSHSWISKISDLIVECLMLDAGKLSNIWCFEWRWNKT